MKITSFHVEASTHCNARCPGCPRNISGYNVKDYFTLQHLSPERYKEIVDAYPSLSYVRINGGLGDPMMNPAIVKIVETSNCLVQITTNGSIGNRKTFERLAEARELSRTLGFEKFHVNAQGRDDFPALDQQGNVSHWIQPHDREAREQKIDTKALIEYHMKNTKYMPENGKRFKISCEHLRGEVYITASGKITPCCYHGTDIADRESISVVDFPKLKATWDTDHCDPTCANSCGKLIVL